jgi:acyl carrier protein
MSVEATLKDLILRKLPAGTNAAAVDWSASLTEGGLGLDSLALVELITEVESSFDFLFDEADLQMQTFANLESLARVVSGHLQGAQSP